MIRLPIAVGALCLASPVAAQGAHAWLDAASDLRERGISMSGGRAGLAGGVGIGSEGPALDAMAITTRGAQRHGGADLRATVTGGYSARLAGSRLRGELAWRSFAGGRGPLNYWEGGAVADTLIGPVTLAAGLHYAPSQRALGGSLAYARIGADGGLPGLPWSLAAHVGRISGETKDPLRAARLRPDSTYIDWAIGLRRTAGPVLLSLTYSDTDIARGRTSLSRTLRSDAGAKVVARAGVDF